jgi:pimeloyl-ACP methyl ester carboxylesterase
MCQEFRLVTIDSRGIGDSQPFVKNWTLFEDLEDVRAVIEELRCDPVTVVGISHTGSMVVALAAMYPHLIDRVVVIGGTFGKPTMQEGVSWMRNWADKTDALLVKRGYAEAVRQLYAECLPQADFRGLSDEWAGYFADYVPEEVFRTLLDVESEFACEPFAKDVKVPTLVMHGTDDLAVPYADGVYLASLVPGAIFYPFVGHGHEPQHTATAEFCDVLSQFVRTGTATAPLVKMASIS